MLSFFLHYWDIVLFALVALVVLFKFYMMLGQGKGIIPRGRSFYRAPSMAADHTPSEEVAPGIVDASAFSPALMQIKRFDASFTLPAFLDRATVAFRFIATTAHEASILPLRGVVSDAVYGLFERALNERQGQGYVSHFSLDKVFQSRLLSLQVDSALVTAVVEFVSRQVHYISHVDLGLVAGSASPVRRTDTWTFRRDFAKGGDAWVLVGTRSS